MRIVVVLPAPFAPRNPKTWPRGASNERPSSATTDPETLGEAVDFEGYRSGQDRRLAATRPSGTTRNARPMSDPGRAVTGLPAPCYGR